MLQLLNNSRRRAINRLITLSYDLNYSKVILKMLVKSCLGNKSNVGLLLKYRFTKSMSQLNEHFLSQSSIPFNVLINA